MNHSAAPSKPTTSVSYQPLRDRAFATAEPSPIRHAWTEELERRRKAVARWRGNDSGLKEAMMRE
ncbi:MAG: hypothetical protein AB7S70_08850 [Hyphomicrobium sp.]|uniref:hypothetical protein n=1 Tax=Hyphomicrobium sp. TaxID=82 RepID=UPI003D0F617C